MRREFISISRNIGPSPSNAFNSVGDCHCSATICCRVVGSVNIAENCKHVHNLFNHSLDASSCLRSGHPMVNCYLRLLLATANVSVRVGPRRWSEGRGHSNVDNVRYEKWTMQSDRERQVWMNAALLASAGANGQKPKREWATDNLATLVAVQATNYVSPFAFSMAPGKYSLLWASCGHFSWNVTNQDWMIKAKQ